MIVRPIRADTQLLFRQGRDRSISDIERLRDSHGIPMSHVLVDEVRGGAIYTVYFGNLRAQSSFTLAEHGREHRITVRETEYRDAINADLEESR
jgi:hypothetical protein